MTERLRFAHQFNPVIAYGDAIGNDCLELQRMFWSSGARSELFAWEAKPEVRALVRDYHDLERLQRRDGLLLVHHSMGNDAVPEVANLPVRKAVVYHNITPSSYFAGLNDELTRYADVGRGVCPMPGARGGGAARGDPPRRGARRVSPRRHRVPAARRPGRLRRPAPGGVPDRPPRRREPRGGAPGAPRREEHTPTSFVVS